MTTYERYIATIEEDMPQYVVDCEGNLQTYQVMYKLS